MGRVAVRVEGLGKRYHIGQLQQAHDTLRDHLAAMARGLLHRRNGSDLPLDAEEDIWALREVSFDVAEGEVLGIIGKNGAGKTTLLKILSRITEPTEGRGMVYGRVASLLEVGTGFHHELTGRENVFLNGAILGMTKGEIEQKFDEIVAFSGVERFIDTPIKRYSTGMTVRLAFAVAAHLEPEILIVDEVLAVGDIEFQRKCLGKMGSFGQSGRTVLFVSHNVVAVQGLCSRVLLLDQGRLVAQGEPRDIIAKYLDQKPAEGASIGGDELANRLEGRMFADNPMVRLLDVRLLNEGGMPSSHFRSDEPVLVQATYRCLQRVHGLRLLVSILDEDNRRILTTVSTDDAAESSYLTRDPGVYRSTCVFPPCTFGQHTLGVTVEVEIPRGEQLYANQILSFDVAFRPFVEGQPGALGPPLRPRLQWTTRLLQDRPG